MAPKKSTPKGVPHSAITGKIVKPGYGVKHPNTTFWVPRPKKK